MFKLINESVLFFKSMFCYTYVYRHSINNKNRASYILYIYPITDMKAFNFIPQLNSMIFCVVSTHSYNTIQMKGFHFVLWRFEQYSQIHACIEINAFPFVPFLNCILAIYTVPTNCCSMYTPLLLPLHKITAIQQ